MHRLATLTLALLGLLLAPAAAAQQTVRVTANIAQNTTWATGNTYLLDGLIFVEEGVTLTIEPGVVVRGVNVENITTGDAASSLIVRRGARILADGTAEQPIIFTAEEDDLDDPTDFLGRDRGHWAGVIVLGYAPTNQPTQDNQIEGIPYDPVTGQGDQAYYGGDDPDDDSGVLRYVSIRHSGYSITGIEGDEIQGLTLGGVGRGTTIEYVEIFSSDDDGIEWFGGTVDVKYAAVAFASDDAFDYDQGWQGRGQFWFTIADSDVAGRAGEHDGGDAAGDDAEPLSRPVISNVTYLGAGQNATVPGGDGNDWALKIRDAAGGFYFNSVFADFPGGVIDIEDYSDGRVDSWTRFEDGDLGFEHNLFHAFGSGDSFAAITRVADPSTGPTANAAAFANALATTNAVADPQLGGISRTNDGGLDPRPALGGPAASGADFGHAELNDGFFTPVGYRGAFEPGAPVWLKGWTALDALGYLSGLATPTEAGATASGFGLEAIYPNPVSRAARVRFALAEPQDVTLAVYDLLGREVATLVTGLQPAGVHAVALDATALPSGVYLVRLATASGTSVQRVSVVR